MNGEQPPEGISITDKIVLPKSTTTLGFPMPNSDWAFLKKKVDEIDSGGHLFQYIGSASIGVAGSAALAALTLPDGNTKWGGSTTFISWFVCVAAIIFAVLCFVCAAKLAKAVVCSKKNVLEEMGQIEQRRQQSQQEDSSAQQKKPARRIIQQLEPPATAEN